MAHLDLHEQEQLSNLKYFWRSFGKYIIGVVVLAFLAYLGSVAWSWSDSNKAAKAAVLYSDFTTAAATATKDKEMSLARQLQLEYPKTEYSAMAGLLAAKDAVKNKDIITAVTMLNWVIDNAKDQGLVSMARLRLASGYIDQQKYDKAMALLLEKRDPAFDPLYYTLRGDLYVAKGELNRARDAYKEALQKAGQDSNTAQGIQMRLDILGNN